MSAAAGARLLSRTTATPEGRTAPKTNCLFSLFASLQWLFPSGAQHLQPVERIQSLARDHAVRLQLGEHRLNGVDNMFPGRRVGGSRNRARILYCNFNHIGVRNYILSGAPAQPRQSSSGARRFSIRDEPLTTRSALGRPRIGCGAFFPRLKIVENRRRLSSALRSWSSVRMLRVILLRKRDFQLQASGQLPDIG